MSRVRNQIGRKPTCNKCGKLKERPKQGYCNSCKAEWARFNRPKYTELSEEQRVKSNARAYLKEYIRRGKVVKGICFCGSADVEAHHNDYLRPLEVVWYCRKHHIELHNNLPHNENYVNPSIYEQGQYRNERKKGKDLILR